MASVVIIGLGTSGLRIIEQARRFHYEFTGAVQPSTVEFLYIDSDISSLSAVNSNNSSSINTCAINVSSAMEAIARLKDSNSVDKSWMPSSVAVNASLSASYVRCGLWASLSEVTSKIEKLYQKVGASADTTFLVVGSLASATTSGLVIDLPYIIRHITSCKNIFGIMLLPNKAASASDTYTNKFVNSYLSLASIHHFTQDHHSHFKVQYPGNISIDSPDRPYKSIQFLSQDFENGANSLTDINSLYKMAGLNLALKFIGSDGLNSNADLLFSVSRKSYKDLAVSVGSDPFYTSCGMMLFQYPKAQLEELVGIELVRTHLINRWIDNKNFIDSRNNSQNISSLKEGLQLQANEDFENVLMQVISKARKQPFLEKSNVIIRVHEDVKHILKGTTKKPTNAHYIYSLFADNGTLNYFKTVDDHVVDLQDSLIESISELVDKKMEECQNLYLVEEYISNLCDAVNSVKSFWLTEYGLSGKKDGWNKLVSSFLIKLQDTFFGAILQEENYYKNLFSEAVDLLYFDRLVNVLDVISENLKNPIFDLESSNNVVLPSTKIVSAIVRKLGRLLDYTAANASLSVDYNNIYTDLKTNSLPQIVYLFEHGNCDGDMKVVLSKFMSSGTKITFTELAGNRTLWNYLSTSQDLYSDCREAGIKYVKVNSLFKDADIATLMEKVSQSHPRYNVIKTIRTGDKDSVRKYLPAMIPTLSPQYFFTYHQFLRLIYLGADMPKFQGILSTSAYQANGLGEYCELKELGNCFVVYQEYALVNSTQWFQPLQHLIYKDAATEKVKYLMNSNSVLFKERNLPYLQIDELQTQINGQK